MEIKLKHLTIICLAIIVGFANCSSNDDDPKEEPNGEKSVYLRMLQKSGERGTSEPVPDNTEVIFNQGTLYFVAVDGQITKQMSITTNQSDDNNINMTEIKAGYEVKNIPGHTKYVHIVGNHDGLPVNPKNISSVIQNTNVTVQMQKGAAGGIEKATLYNTSSAELVLVSANKYKATVELSPHASRIEIADVTAEGDVTEYQLDGIFINNYYQQVQVDRTTSQADLKDNGSEPNNYIGDQDPYPSTLPLYDYNVDGIGTFNSNVVKPDPAGHVWAYNVLAGSPAPRIILRLNKIKINGQLLNGVRFVTIKGFIDNSTSQLITTFEPGKIYTIAAGDLKFDENDLTTIPEVGTIDVEVKVTLISWRTKPVTPEL